MDFSKILVKKPWGEEYEVFNNEDISLWHLIIKPGHKTSLHCHPKKKTGLIVLDGHARLDFLSGYNDLQTLDKRIIRPSVFHSTTNTGITDLHLLEVETPKDKLDLLRLEDDYSRAGTPYESEKNFEPLIFKRFNFSTYSIGMAQFLLNITATRKLVDSSYRPTRPEKILILHGRIHREDIEVAGPGDILDEQTIGRLLDKFDATKLDIVSFSLVKQ